MKDERKRRPAEQFVERLLARLCIQFNWSYQKSLAELVETVCFLANARGELNLAELKEKLDNEPKPGPDWAREKLIASRASMLFRSTSARRLGKNQRVILRRLVQAGRWDYPGLWNYGGTSATKSVLIALVERGLVKQITGKGCPASFEPADHLRECGICRTPFCGNEAAVVKVDNHGRFATCSLDCRRALMKHEY